MELDRFEDMDTTVRKIKLAQRLLRIERGPVIAHMEAVLSAVHADAEAGYFEPESIEHLDRRIIDAEKEIARGRFSTGRELFRKMGFTA
jgi:hypothetical protein